MSINVYLIYGEDEERMLSEKQALIERLLPAEYRNENLTEIDPPVNRPLELKSCVYDMLSELGTLSFFPESRRLLVVNNLHDFYSAGSKAKKKTAAKGKQKKEALTPQQLLIRFLDRELSDTGNLVIFYTVENFEKRRTVSKANALFKWIKQKGQVTECKPPENPVFKFRDAILDRNVASALAYLRQLMKSDRGPQSAFYQILSQVHFLIQAKMLQTPSARASQEEFAERFFPGDQRLNLTRQHPFVQKNIQRAASRFSFNELNDALRGLFQINQLLYPSSEDVYVPDVKLQLELLVIALCNRRG